MEIAVLPVTSKHTRKTSPGYIRFAMLITGISDATVIALQCERFGKEQSKYYFYVTNTNVSAMIVCRSGSQTAGHGPSHQRLIREPSSGTILVASEGPQPWGHTRSYKMSC
jgi:hypothetical protein